MHVGYLGYSGAMVKALLESCDFELCVCICERSRWNDRLESLLMGEAVNICLIDGNCGLEQAMADAETEMFLMCSFGIILPVEIVERYQIINFHPGSLENNRGRTPIVNSILRGDSYSKMTAYVVGRGIDEGKEISSRLVCIDKMMGTNDLAKKLDAQIPMMLPEIHDYLANGVVHATKGLYVPRVSPEAASLDLTIDTLTDVVRKVRSQDVYGGAVGPRGRVKEVEVCRYEWNLLKNSNEESIYQIVAEVRMKKGN